MAQAITAATATMIQNSIRWSYHTSLLSRRAWYTHRTLIFDIPRSYLLLYFHWSV